MGKTKIFISSTCYDLSQIRQNLKDSITAIGHIPIMSENKDFPVNPSLNSAENCIEAVRNEADVFVLIIGNKYGFKLDSGKSITNTEFLTALNKGIPIYTFTLKSIVHILPVWKKNPNVDYSNVVDDNKVFEFVEEVRVKNSIWNFEFESAQDIVEILKSQLSFLFSQALVSHQRLQRVDSALASKLSNKALKFLLDQEENYEILVLMQMMQDEIDRYKYLKKDCDHSIIFKPGPYISGPIRFSDWQQEKLQQVEKIIGSLNNLFDAFNYYIGEPGVQSDIDGLYYVAHKYGELYASLLEWVIDIRSANFDDIYTNVTQVLSQIPAKAIAQLESFPGKSMANVRESLEAVNLGTLGKDATLKLTLRLAIDDSVMDEFKSELEKLTKKLVR